MRARLPFILALLLAACLGGAPHATATRAPQSAVEVPALRLTGEASDVRLREEDKSGVGFDFKLRLKFVNGGGEPVILLSEDANKLWLAVTTLSRSPEDAAAGKFILTRAAWPSNYRTGDPDRRWERLTERLDQPTPPVELTRVLAPGGVREYETDWGLYIGKDGSYDGKTLGWAEIRKTSPLWLTVTFEMWPINVEPGLDAESAFGKKLRRRWRYYGTLWLDDLVSDPLELRLPEAVIKGDGR